MARSAGFNSPREAVSFATGYLGDDYRYVPPRKKRSRSPKFGETAAVRSALKNAPTGLKSSLREMASDPQLNEGVKAMMERSTEFSSPMAAFLSGTFVFEPARRALDRLLDNAFKGVKLSSSPKQPIPEVVLGAGLHAAIYCAVRARLGKPMPVIIDNRKRVGGVFAISREPSFWLNSRNRPGPLSLPGEGGALNVMPGAVVQPSDLGGGEYQTNADLAWAIRTNLAMTSAKVALGRKLVAISVDPDREGYMLVMESGDVVWASRVIIATGPGDLNRLDPEPDKPPPDRLITGEEFMERMDGTFPLRGIERLAVIGAGDMGKCVIESACGQGPARGMSVAALDWPQTIDWWGQSIKTKDKWCAANRGRYARIGKLLEGRVTPREARSGTVAGGFGCAYVRDVSYDLVVNCTGYNDGAWSVPETWKRTMHRVEGRRTARRYQDTADESMQEIYLIGPAASITVDDVERENPALRNIAEGNVTAFRYAGRTAALAGSLD